MAPSRGTIVALLGVLLLAAVVFGGLATAPDRSVAGETATALPASTQTAAPSTPAGSPTGPPGNATLTGTTLPPTAGPRTLVGIQGGWVTGGNVRLYADGQERWRETSADGYFEVSLLPDGSVLAAFANETSTDCGNLDTAECARTGFRHIDPAGPDGPTVIAEYGFPVTSLTNSEVHAVDRIGEGEYVFVDMDRERVVVVADGAETWVWNASERYEAPPDPTSRDWLHMNDVDAIGDDRFLVSVRNANQLVVLERGAGVVDVVNEDSGTADANCRRQGRLYDADGDDDVTCGDPAVIKEQHNPQWLGPGAVLVADSENDRVVELHETDGVWDVAWVLREANGLELDWPRDADRLPNGNTLITDSLNQRVVEVDPDGEVVWVANTAGSGSPQIPYEADRLPFGEFAGQYESTPSPTTPQTLTETTTGANPATATPTQPPGYTLPTANGSGDPNTTGSTIPGLTLAIVAMRGTFGWLPLWFAEIHLAGTIVAALLLVGGGVDHVRNPDRTVQIPGRE
jgi:hypothetical protein